MTIPEIVIGSEASEHIAIAVTRREFPESTDYWDGNWVYATVRIRVGAFRGEYEAQLRTDEIAHLRSGLVHLHAELSGNASFESMEEWLKMSIEGDGRGHFVAKCEARDQPGTGNTLRFELRFDQTELPPVIAALDAVLAAFPVKGAPTG
ncbi:MAG TPA: hypothetical protein VFS67_15515 [Polyangiaceae bacterium]|nr:hypothetical protein [Polyangiaceae bacterium]